MNINEMNNILILGDGNIGKALAQKIYYANKKSKIHLTSRSIKDSEGPFTIHTLDPLSDMSWHNFTNELQKVSPSLDLVISTYGVLHSKEGLRPEKSLREIDLSKMIESFSINAFTAPLIAKYLQPFFSKNTPSILAFLSAKVGSIEDNKIGGWYSYRASKAALNMFIKTISIEYSRNKLKTKVLSIHPGTTLTKLSGPFLKTSHLKIWTPEQTSVHILNVLENSEDVENGSFLNWDGTELPW